MKPSVSPALSHLQRGALRIAFAAAAGALVWGHAALAHDNTLKAFDDAPAQASLMDSDLLGIVRKAGDIYAGAAADRRRVQSIGVNVENLNRQGGGHISRPENPFKA